MIRALYSFYALPTRRRVTLYLWLMLALIVYGAVGIVFGAPERLISIKLVLLCVAVLIGVPLHRSFSKGQISEREAAALLEPPDIDSFCGAAPYRGAQPPLAEPCIYVDAPVASVLHRSIGGAVDLAAGCFSVPVYFFIAWVVGGRGAFLLAAASIPLNLMVYGIQQAFIGRATVGMRWAALEWISFDGTAPTSRRRLLHALANCLSALTLVGLIWSLVDEEGLTWADHIAGIFPTLREYAERAERLRAPQSASSGVKAKLIKTDLALWNAKAGRLGVKGPRRLKVG